ncbi:MAG TPA: DUF4097 family beta strand repeat-containing protein [Mycobacteriales bacterium]|jgi:hypothetical protein|nr:DUF4097 family beta strand repeat-containing protein [Mycobacteriales bacterium]
MRSEVFETSGEVRLQVSIKSGRVELSTHDRPAVEVEVSAPSNPSYADQIKIEHIARTGRDDVRVTLPDVGALGFLSGQHRHEVDVVVRLPRGSALDLSTASAPVEAAGRYGSVRASSASGDVHLEAVGGELSAQTASGAVSVESVGGPAKIRTAAGDVSVGSAAAALVVMTASGQLQAGTVHGAQLRSASGDQSVDNAVCGNLELTTSSGDVRVGIARGSGVHVDATTVSGDLQSDIDLDGEPGESNPAEPNQVDLKVRTVSGDVRIRRGAELVTS